MIVRRQARATLTVVELDIGDVLEFTLTNGAVRRLELAGTDAGVFWTTLKQVKVPKGGCWTDYRFRARLRVDGEPLDMEREVATERSFYEPWETAGLRIWLDAVCGIGDFLNDNSDCLPRKAARLALQDASLRICPETLHPWCPLPQGGLRIKDCYRGEDCWLGAYDGAVAHPGLDVNHPTGTPLWTPLAIDDHFLFNSLAAGDVNNRWRGFHRWEDGSRWILQSSHMTELTVPEHERIPKGTQYARGAGVHVGIYQHSHFFFAVEDAGETIPLDPWILFWQMYRDAEANTSGPKA